MLQQTRLVAAEPGPGDRHRPGDDRRRPRLRRRRQRGRWLGRPGGGPTGMPGRDPPSASPGARGSPCRASALRHAIGHGLPPVVGWLRCLCPGRRTGTAHRRIAYGGGHPRPGRPRRRRSRHGGGLHRARRRTARSPLPASRRRTVGRRVGRRLPDAAGWQAGDRTASRQPYGRRGRRSGGLGTPVVACAGSHRRGVDPRRRAALRSRPPPSCGPRSESFGDGLASGTIDRWTAPVASRYDAATCRLHRFYAVGSQ